jgi:hypothetical protein
MFIQFFTTSATISNSNLGKKELYQRNYIPMIVKINRAERGKNKKSRQRRGLSLTRIILHQHKNFRERVQKEKAMVRTGQDRASPLFCASWEHTL